MRLACQPHISLKTKSKNIKIINLKFKNVCIKYN